ncbi:TetR/AcrR family transcriptional regulator [Chelatococcus reniformis]|uniref:TetR family transcriptional regulator n=1 Tax=Chelatococcus reniformis TaxID=1494448 RepID=A0A916UZ47_9HYPH|nr:TetR/AcrR family transcriptional regulator [Chelatococcus reniformis]GGC94547.1 TetR family transcriptional regulator [Chelatococcus reniformis]
MVESNGDGPARADARRSLAALLQAAKEVFSVSGVDAPVRMIAEKAGVGVGTVYRHFPQRSDLIVAVFRNEVDACANAAPVLAAQCPPGEALDRWLQRFIAFVATKRGFAAALHSGDPAYEPLPNYLLDRLAPALGGLLSAAAAAGKVRADVEPVDLLLAIARLAAPDDTGGLTAQSRRMLALLFDGLRLPPGAMWG